MSADHNIQSEDDDVVIRSCLGKLYQKSNSPVWGDSPDDRLYMFVAYELTGEFIHYQQDKPGRMYITTSICSDGMLYRWALSAKSFINGYLVEVRQP